MLRALGAIGAELMQQDQTAWKGRLVDLLSVDEGVIVETGEPKAFFASPREERTRRFLEKVL